MYILSMKLEFNNHLDIKQLFYENYIIPRRLDEWNLVINKLDINIFSTKFTEFQQ